MSSKNIFFIISLLSSTLTWGEIPHFNPEKTTFCTMTINSSDEGEMFKAKINGGSINGKKYMKQEDGKKIQFVELTDFESDSEEKGNWFDNACKSKIKCDVLLISGHFGGKFFGNKGINLSSNQLENASCSQNCQGILNNPLEVFLFGCNTLAGKKPDSRTPEEYIEVLIEDGYSQTEAEQVASLRYSPIGNTFRAQMQRTFEGVPHIYGFKERAPLGKNVAHMVENYLDEKGDYYSYLLKERTKQGLEILSEVSSTNNSSSFSYNQELLDALRVTHFTQITQNKSKPSGCHTQNPTLFNDIDKNIRCTIRDKNKPLIERLMAADQALSSKKDMLSYLPSINELFMTIDIDKLSSQEEEILKRIKKNIYAKDTITGLIPKMNSMPILAFNLIDVSKKIGWLDIQTTNKLKLKLLKSMLKAKISLEGKDLICSLNTSRKISSSLKVSDIHQENFKTSYGIETLECLKVTSENVQLQIAKSIVNGDRETRKSAVGAFIDIMPASELVHHEITKGLKDSYWEVQVLTANTLREIKPTSKKIHLEMVKALKDYDSDFDSDAIRRLSNALIEIKPCSSSVLSAIKKAGYRSIITWECK